MQKIIHYCWFGGKELPELTVRCIETWKKFLPDFEIKQWNEKNFDVTQCKFVKQAYEQKKWAFVADYTRFKVLEEYGGLYLDTDMEITSDISRFLQNSLFFGTEDSKMINAAVVWSKEKENLHISRIVKKYEETEKFNPTGDLFDQSVPKVLTNYFEEYGFDLEKNEIQILNDKGKNQAYIYPMEYFYPLSYDHQHNNFTDNSCMIHHFDATWTSKMEQFKMKLKRKNMNWIIYIIDFFVTLKQIFSIKQIILLLLPYLLLIIPIINNLNFKISLTNDLFEYFMYTTLFTICWNITLNELMYNKQNIKNKSIKKYIYPSILTIFLMLSNIIFINYKTPISITISFYAFIVSAFNLYWYIYKVEKIKTTNIVFIAIFISLLFYNINIIFIIVLKILFILAFLVMLFKKKVEKRKYIIYFICTVIFNLITGIISFNLI